MIAIARQLKTSRGETTEWELRRAEKVDESLDAKSGVTEAKFGTARAEAEEFGRLDPGGTTRSCRGLLWIAPTPLGLVATFLRGPLERVNP